MKMRGSDLPSYHGKSNFWNHGGRSLWCSSEPDPLLKEGAGATASAACWRVSTLVVRVSIVLARLAMMVARSAAAGSAMVDVTDGVGDGGVVGLSGGVVEDDEEHLIFDPIPLFFLL